MVAGGLGRALRLPVGSLGRGKACQPSVDPADKHGDGGVLLGRAATIVGPGGELEDVQSFLQAGLLVQEVGIGDQAHPHRRVFRGERLIHGIDQCPQMRAFCVILGKFLDKMPGAAQLPAVPFGVVAVPRGPMHPIDQARHQKSRQGQLGIDLTPVLALLPRASQERAMPRYLGRFFVGVEQDVRVFAQQAVPCRVGEMAWAPTNMARILRLFQGGRRASRSGGTDPVWVCQP